MGVLLTDADITTAAATMFRPPAFIAASSASLPASPPLDPATRLAVFFCMSLNMLKKPLLRLGVRLCLRPSISIKSGCVDKISCGVQPDRPCTSSAARPLVNAESESARQYTLPSSRSSGFTHTCKKAPAWGWRRSASHT
eukprot:365900-Chlamydomonas_euryale.AAC.10